MKDHDILSHIFGLIGATPALQLVLIVLAAVAWLIGGNAVVASHYRRMGKPWWHLFKPGGFPLLRFNRREWILLGLAFAVSFTLGIMAVTLGAPAGA